MENINAESATAQNTELVEEQTEILEAMSKAKAQRQATDKRRSKRARRRAYREQIVGTTYNLSKTCKDLHRVDSEKSRKLGRLPVEDVTDDNGEVVEYGAKTIIATFLDSVYKKFAEDPDKWQDNLDAILLTIEENGPSVSFYTEEDAQAKMEGVINAMDIELARIALAAIPMVPDKFKWDGDIYQFVSTKRRMYLNDGACPIDADNDKRTELSFTTTAGSMPRSYYDQKIVEEAYDKVYELSEVFTEQSEDNEEKADYVLALNGVRVTVFKYREMKTVDEWSKPKGKMNTLFWKAI